MKLLLLALPLLLAACGGRQALQPPPGEQLPVAPATDTVAPTAIELLDPPAYARPERFDEVLRRSEEREDDRFDLPPQ